MKARVLVTFGERLMYEKTNGSFFTAAFRGCAGANKRG